MPIAVIAESPMPVSRRAAKSPKGSQAAAFSNENRLNHVTAMTSARLRPTRSANQPPVVAPRNMPKNVAEVMIPMVPMEMPHWARIAGAEKAKMLMSPSSKKKQKPRSHIMWRWKEKIGSRSRRAAAETRWISCTFIARSTSRSCGAPTTAL